MTGFATPPLRCLLRYAWASPATLVGVGVAILALCTGARVRLVDGALEVAGGCLLPALARAQPCAPFVAVTLGHVIVAIDDAVLARTRAHERVHVRQYERWGVLFFPLYLLASVSAALRGRDVYRDNAFEREAYARARR